MIIWLFKHIILSLVLIISIHYTYVFLKDNLTTPKTIDLIQKPKEKYSEIYKSLKEDTSDDKINDNMKDELKSYLKELTSNNDTNEPNTIDNYSEQSYSNY